MKRIVSALGKLKRGKRAWVVLVLCATTAMALPAQTFTTLLSFSGPDGENPYGGLVQGTDGNLYGTTKFGGASGLGTVFKITPSGALTTLYNFCSQAGCTDGHGPMAGLVQATNGDFYGTTVYGGANTNPDAPDGGGTVFEITPRGELTVLYSFCSQSGCTDGEYPVAGLIQASNGDFYGTTSSAGANCSYPCGGTIFKITPSGTLTTLHSFCSQPGCTDGGAPFAGLVQAADGDLYGTTSEGGADGQDGTVFKITPSGTLTTLYSFCSESGAQTVDTPRCARPGRQWGLL
jgi:uncharacterized repeat protein (TIGR03803 family)